MARQQGFAVTFKGFIPTPNGDLKAQGAAISALQAAQEGKPDALMGLMEGMSVDFKQTSRKEEGDGSPSQD